MPSLTNRPKTSRTSTKKRGHDRADEATDDEVPHHNAVKPDPAKTTSNNVSDPNTDPKIHSLIEEYGKAPLSGLPLDDIDKPIPSTLLAHLYNAILSSARISHEIAHHSVKCLIEAGYADIKTLKKSSWQERTEVLTKGGYTHYREKTATYLGEMQELIEHKYCG